MDKTTLRPLVFEALRRMPQTHVHAIENEIRQKATDYERGDALLVQEVVWELLLQGILAPGKNSLNLHLPFIHVTEYGQKCLDAGAEAAYDPEGYVARLRAETAGEVSTGVLESARDAILSFHRGLFRASLVLLSRAAVEVLGELALACALPCVAGSFTPSSESRAAFGTALRQALEEIRGGFSPDELERGLTELETLAGLAHSDKSLPRLPVDDRESALGRLLLFPAQCKFAYALMARRHASRRTEGT
jgi:hypothetical protein